MGNSKLLFNKSPLVIDPDLATMIGLHESIIIQQVHYWLKINEKSNKNFHDGYYWTFNSYSEWQKQFPFWSESAVQKIFRRLEKAGYLVTANYNKMKIDRTKWYRINYDMLKDPVLPPISTKCDMEHAQCELPIPENSTKNTSYGSSKIQNRQYVKLKLDDIEEDFLRFYLLAHKRYLKRDHVRVTEENLSYINEIIDKLKDHGVDNEIWETAVTEHFSSLPKSNNGNILAFFKATERYFQIDPYREL